jgi:Scramblase
MDELAAAQALLITQQKEMVEIFTNFETKNRYIVTDENGRQVYLAAEEGTGLLSRNLLKSARPWTIHVVRPDGTKVLAITRPWRWFFHEVAIHDAEGRFLGTVQRRWSWLRRLYSVCDDVGDEVCELFGPILHPWTFQIRAGGMDVGAIRKKWSGLLTEAYTKADNFGIQFPPDADPSLKAVLLGAVFLIDFCHFEKSNNR